MRRLSAFSAGAEVLQHDVGDGAQRLQLREARSILQIDRD